MWPGHNNNAGCSARFEFSFELNLLLRVNKVTLLYWLVLLPDKHRLGINLPWPALKIKQCMCVENFLDTICVDSNLVDI